MKRYTIKFNCQDIANTRGVEVEAVYRAISRGTLDISDLKSISKYILGDERKQIISQLISTLRGL